MHEWIPAISSIAGLVTAVAALFTVLEMRRQRIGSHKPEFSLPSISYYAYSKDGTVRPPFVWSRVELSKSQLTEADLLDEVIAVDCFNIGVASAKDVRAYWEYDVHAFVAKIARLDPEHEFEYSIGERTLHSNLGRLYIQDLEEPIHLHHIVAAASNHNSTSIPVPPAYLELLSSHAFLSGQSLSKAIESGTDHKNAVPKFSEVPALVLTIKYEDIGGLAHTRKFEVNPRVVRVSTRDAGSSLEVIAGHFDVRELGG